MSMTNKARKSSLALLIAGVLAGVSTNSVADEWEVNMGVGAASVDTAWKGMDSETFVLPMMQARYGNWSFGIDGINYQLLHNRNSEFTLSAGIDYRDDTYDPSYFQGGKLSNDPVFNGYKSKDGDVVFQTSVEWGMFSFAFEKDISGNSKAETYEVGFTLPLLHKGNFSLSFDSSASILSSDYANFVYGISSDQVDADVGREEYHITETAINYTTGLNAAYKLDDRWSIIGGLHYEKLDGVIVDSPLIDSDKMTMGFVGVTYRF